MNEEEYTVEGLERTLKGEYKKRSSSSIPEIPPAELLKRSTSARLIQYCLIDWSIILGCWLVISIGVGPWWCYLPLSLIIAGRLHALGVILHDATHMSQRKKSLDTKIVEILAGYPIASTLNAMRYHHLRHHRDNGMPTDPYFKPTLHGKRKLYFFMVWLRYLILMPLWTIRAPYGLIAAMVPALRTSYAKIFLQDKSGKNLTQSTEVIACARAELGQVLFQSFIFILFLRYPVAVLYDYFIPLMITGLLAGYRVLVEHNYLPAEDHSMKTIFETTNDHNLGLIGKLILAPRNVGCHIVHHLHPQVGLQYLPALRDWYKAKYSEIYPSVRYWSLKT